MKKRNRKREGGRRAGPVARLPLPAKGEKRHGDATKYERSREKARLRRELDPG
jgi:hypothetical protein